MNVASPTPTSSSFAPDDSDTESCHPNWGTEADALSSKRTANMRSSQANADFTIQYSANNPAASSLHALKSTTTCTSPPPVAAANISAPQRSHGATRHQDDSVWHRPKGPQHLEDTLSDCGRSDVTSVVSSTVHAESAPPQKLLAHKKLARAPTQVKEEDKEQQAEATQYQPSVSNSDKANMPANDEIERVESLPSRPVTSRTKPQSESLATVTDSTNFVSTDPTYNLLPPAPPGDNASSSSSTPRARRRHRKRSKSRQRSRQATSEVGSEVQGDPIPTADDRLPTSSTSGIVSPPEPQQPLAPPTQLSVEPTSTIGHSRASSTASNASNARNRRREKRQGASPNTAMRPMSASKTIDEAFGISGAPMPNASVAVSRQSEAFGENVRDPSVTAAPGSNSSPASNPVEPSVPAPPNPPNSYPTEPCAEMAAPKETDSSPQQPAVSQTQTPKSPRKSGRSRKASEKKKYMKDEAANDEDVKKKEETVDAPQSIEENPQQAVTGVLQNSTPVNYVAKTLTLGGSAKDEAAPCAQVQALLSDTASIKTTPKTKKSKTLAKANSPDAGAPVESSSGIKGPVNNNVNDAVKPQGTNSTTNSGAMATANTKKQESSSIVTGDNATAKHSVNDNAGAVDSAPSPPVSQQSQRIPASENANDGANVALIGISADADVAPKRQTSLKGPSSAGALKPEQKAVLSSQLKSVNPTKVVGSNSDTSTQGPKDANLELAAAATQLPISTSTQVEASQSRSLKRDISKVTPDAPAAISQESILVDFEDESAAKPKKTDTKVPSFGASDDFEADTGYYNEDAYAADDFETEVHETDYDNYEPDYEEFPVKESTHDKRSHVTQDSIRHLESGTDYQDGGEDDYGNDFDVYTVDDDKSRRSQYDNETRSRGSPRASRRSISSSSETPRRSTESRYSVHSVKHSSSTKSRDTLKQRSTTSLHSHHSQHDGLDDPFAGVIRVNTQRKHANSSGTTPPSSPGPKSARPAWRPNTLRTSIGWEYVPPTPRTPSADPHKTRSLSIDAGHRRPKIKEVEPRPAWASPTGKRLHESYKVINESEKVKQIVKEKCETPVGTRSLRRPSTLSTTTGTRSLVTTPKSAKKERWPASSPGATTFSNLPVKKARGRSRTRDLDEPKESLAEKTRREMKALAKARQRSRGNWSSRASRFVSQVKQPAWAEPHILQEPPPKPMSANKIAKGLERKAEHAPNIAAELKSRIDHIRSLEEVHGKSGTPEHIHALIKLSRFWLLQNNCREALRVALTGKSVIRQVYITKKAEILESLRGSEHVDPTHTSGIALLRKLVKDKRYDDIAIPVKDLEKVAKMEAHLDKIISAMVDARLRDFGIEGHRSKSNVDIVQTQGEPALPESALSTVEPEIIAQQEIAFAPEEEIFEIHLAKVDHPVTEDPKITVKKLASHDIDKTEIEKVTMAVLEKTESASSVASNSKVQSNKIAAVLAMIQNVLADNPSPTAESATSENFPVVEQQQQQPKEVGQVAEAEDDLWAAFPE
ncbi:hypothetical protein HDV05_004889 [Chytridiales sp. JEL 0842]|nr:hypothetical protein HDV05_004889 [Chytridiales sp. JEL 0842]